MFCSFNADYVFVDLIEKDREYFVHFMQTIFGIANLDYVRGAAFGG